jgi:hypothetical protein
MQVLTLLVAVLALFFSLVGPYVTWANVQRQTRAMLRESWMRQFREKIAELMNVHVALLARAPDDDLADQEAALFFAVDLLLAERGDEYRAFRQTVHDYVFPEEEPRMVSEEEFTEEAAKILRRERATIEADLTWRWSPSLRGGALPRAGS